MNGKRWTPEVALIFAGLISAGCLGGVQGDPPDPACPTASPGSGGQCELRKTSCAYQEGPCAVSYGCTSGKWFVDTTVCSPAAVGCSMSGEVCETPGAMCAVDNPPCPDFAECGADHHWHYPGCSP